MKRKYISNMPIEGFSKYHICKNGRLYSIHSGTWRLIKPVAKSTGYISNNLISDYLILVKELISIDID